MMLKGFIVATSLLLSFLVIGQDYSDSSQLKLNDRSDEMEHSIMLLLDVSMTMNATDYSVNRLESVKSEITKFISKRPQDKIGLLLFARTLKLVSPPTNEHLSLKKELDNVEKYRDSLGGNENVPADISQAIIEVANSEFWANDSINKIIVLVTDGRPTNPNVPLDSAGLVAANMGIPIYIIGIGSKGKVLLSVPTVFGIEKDSVDVYLAEEEFKTISSSTGGNFYRSNDNESLSLIFQQINQLINRRRESLPK